jgi:hypothetical protein
MSGAAGGGSEWQGDTRTRCVIVTAAQRLQGVLLARRLHLERTMSLLMVTCPESAHLETLEVRRDARGLTVLGCSAFGDLPCEVTCERTCVARLNKKHFGERRVERKALPPGTVLLARSCLAR